VLKTMPNSISEFDKKLMSLIRSLQNRGPVLFLDTQDGGSGFLAAGAKRMLTCWGSTCVFEENSTKITQIENPWDALKAFRNDTSWSFGYLGYDLKNFTEKLSSSNSDLVGAPDLIMIEPEILFSIDRKNERIESVYPNDVEIPESSEIIDLSSVNVKPIDDEFQREPYKKAIQKAQESIFQGDFYEINLSRQTRGIFNGDALSLYFGMKSFGPVPFGAFLDLGSFSVSCASPERFLKKTGTIIQSEPIKGTAPVSENEEENSQLIQTLHQSEKNRAENLMIVDLVRNDFSRIAKPGTVEVEELFRIYRFKTVFQMISKVKAEVKATSCPVEIIKNCFPMGSMTGAPKISAMEHIEALETYKRGIYSGAIGVFKPGGDFDFNVVIRTAICKENNWFYSTGGAITADSDPDEEWEETRVKMRAIVGLAVK